MNKFIELKCFYTGDTILINIDYIDVIIRKTTECLGTEYSKVIVGDNSFTILETADEIISMIDSKMQA